MEYLLKTKFQRFLNCLVKFAGVASPLLEEGGTGRASPLLTLVIDLPK